MKKKSNVTKSNARQYEQQWDVPSDSDPAAYYTVSLTREGEYVCHCWPFLRDRTKPCKHIRKVQAGEAAPRGQAPKANQPLVRTPSPPTTGVREPRIVLCNVRGVTPVSNAAGTEVIEVKTPPIPAGNDHFLLTVLFDLLKNGVTWDTLRQRYQLPRDVTLTWVKEYIRDYGRLTYGPWTDGVGFDGFTYLPPADAV